MFCRLDILKFEKVRSTVSLIIFSWVFQLCISWFTTQVSWIILREYLNFHNNFITQILRPSVPTPCHTQSWNIWCCPTTSWRKFPPFRSDTWGRSWRWIFPLESCVRWWPYICTVMCRPMRWLNSLSKLIAAQDHIPAEHPLASMLFLVFSPRLDHGQIVKRKASNKLIIKNWV